MKLNVNQSVFLYLSAELQCTLDQRDILLNSNLLVGSNSAHKDYIVETKEKGIRWALFNVKTWIIYPQEKNPVWSCLNQMQDV